MSVSVCILAVALFRPHTMPAHQPDESDVVSFGRVVRGMDVVHAIHGQAADAESDSAYTAGQILTTPVIILEARRKAESGDGA